MLGETVRRCLHAMIQRRSPCRRHRAGGPRELSGYDGPRRPGPTGISPATIVSDPAGTEELAARAGAAAGAADPVTYVSFPPGTFSTSGQGGALTVLNQRTIASLTTGLQDGGLDPVPLPAEPGDTLAFDRRHGWGAVNRIHHRGAGREAPNGRAH